jgi:putative ABC transport system ATP-binding protein
MAYIEVKNITKTYEMDDTPLTVLRGVSLEIDQGDYVAIMGASGSGKSTLMHILGCLDHKFNGDYLLDGIPIKKVSQNKLTEIRRNKIGFVFQSFNLINKLNVRENVALPMVYNRTKNKKNVVEDILTLVGLSHRMSHFPNQLSGGERQRVAIARSLVNNPAVILADEPTGNLDSISGKNVMETIGNLNNQGKTVILVTHDRQIAEHAKYIIHIKDGLIESIEK